MARSVYRLIGVAWLLYLAWGWDGRIHARRERPADQALAEAIGAEFGQPPRRALELIRTAPDARRDLREASERSGVDVHALAAMFLAEVDGELPPPGDLGVAADALAAALRERQDEALAELHRLGVAQPSAEDALAAAYLFHRSADARRLLSQALAAQGRAARMGFLRDARGAYEGAGQTVATAVLLRCARVFEAARRPGTLGGWKPGPERGGALGLIERLERAAEF